MDFKQDERVQDDEQITKTLRGEYEFDVINVIKRANSNLTQHFSAMFTACLILFVCVLLLSLTFVMVMGLQIIESMTPMQQGLIEIISVFVIAPLQAGLYIMGVRTARGQSVSPTEVFAHLGALFVIALAQLVISFLVKLGMALLVLPGIYIWLATIFTLPLIVDKHMSPMRAIVLSIKVVNCYIAKMSGFFLVIVLLFALSFITFGIALIWVAPLYFCAVGILFNDMFGTELQLSNTSPVNESSFDA